MYNCGIPIHNIINWFLNLEPVSTKLVFTNTEHRDYSWKSNRGILQQNRMSPIEEIF